MSITKAINTTAEYYVGYKLLSLIATQYTDFPAFHLGLIDDRGNKLKKAKSKEEKDAMSSITILALNFKKTAIFNPTFYAKLKVSPMLAMREATEDHIELNDEIIYDMLMAEAMITGDVSSDSAKQAAGITSGSIVVTAADNVKDKDKVKKRNLPGVPIQDENGNVIDDETNIEK